MMNNLLKAQVMITTNLRLSANKALDVLTNDRGDGNVDRGLGIMISVVIGMLFLGGLYYIFKDTIIPTLKIKITEMFNYNG